MKQQTKEEQKLKEKVEELENKLKDINSNSSTVNNKYNRKTIHLPKK